MAAAERLWWIALLAIFVAITSALLTGGSRLTVAAAIVALGITVLAVVVQGPPPRNRRQPW